MGHLIWFFGALPANPEARVARKARVINRVVKEAIKWAWKMGNRKDLGNYDYDFFYCAAASHLTDYITA